MAVRKGKAKPVHSTHVVKADSSKGTTRKVDATAGFLTFQTTRFHVRGPRQRRAQDPRRGRPAAPMPARLRPRSAGKLHGQLDRRRSCNLSR